MSEFRVELGLPPVECSPNWRGHWAVKARAVKSYRALCAFDMRCGVRSGGSRAFPFQEATIDAEYRAWRGAPGYCPKDLDNAVASLKSAIDALKDAGVIVSDAKRWLRWGHFRLLTTRREIERDGKQPGVTVIVRELK